MTQTLANWTNLYPTGEGATLNIAPSSFGVTTLDATGEKFAMIGRIFIDGRPASAKTMGGGSSAISFWVNATSVLSGASTFAIGMQDILTGSGPPAQPDETFDTSISLAAGGLTADSWNTKSFASATGTKSITHGQMIALVFDFTNRTGSDLVIINGCYGGSLVNNPLCVQKLAGAWTVNGNIGPLAGFVFSDGTLGWFYAVPVVTGLNQDVITDASGNDEIGMIFQVPWDCTIDGYMLVLGNNVADADFDVRLYSTPLGTPAVVSGSTVSMLGEQMFGGFAMGRVDFLLSAPIALTKDTDYCLAVRANSTGQVFINYMTTPDTMWRAFFPKGSSLRKATRNWTTGSDPGTAFTEESPAVTLHRMNIRIASFNDTSGSGGGLIRHPGMSGGLIT